MNSSRFPHPLVLIFGLVVLAAFAALFVPPGSYALEKSASGRDQVVPGSFRFVTERVATPDANAPERGSYPDPPAAQDWSAPLVDPFLKLSKGLEEGQDVIFLIFIVGGVIAVLRRTGAIDALIGTAIRNLGGNSLALVGGMMLLFAAGSSTIGMAEEYMPFVPILTAMCLSLGMDAVVALGIVYIGAGIGYGCAVFNPFTVVIARTIAGHGEAPFALAVRLGMTALMIVIGTHHLLRYAHRIRRDPGLSLVRDVDYSEGFHLPEDTALTPRRGLILALFAAMIGVFLWGAKTQEWFLTELNALFLALALVAAVIARLHPNTVARAFCEGAAEMTTTALLVGVARTIQVILDDAQISHTIVHGIASALPSQEGLSWVAGLGMLALQSVCNFFIPSGSGQAYVTMPIMAPLATVTGVGRETAVLAYQIGDGLTNMIVPTNALLMGMLALGRVPFLRWLRFILPLMVKLYLVAIVAVVIASIYAWGG